MSKYCVLAIFALFLFCTLSRAHDDEFAEFDDLAASTSANHADEKLKSSFASKEKDSKPKSSDVTDKPQHAELSDKTSGFDLPVGENGNKAIHETSEGNIADKPDLKLVDAPPLRIYPWESYYIEILFIFASFLYLINFFVGSSKNHTVASSWYEKMREALKVEFTLVGGAPVYSDKTKGDDDESVSTLKKQRGLIKSTDAMYTLWCSGRQGLDGLLIEINLMKRQDLFSMALGLLKNTRDTMILRFLLNNDGYENFVFCIAQKSHATKLARDMIDINTFCSKRKPVTQYGLDNHRLFVMSELSDTASYIMDNETITFLKRYENIVNYIHITDQFSTVRSEDMTAAQKLANPKRMATFSFALPKNQVERVELFSYSLNLLDRLRRYKLARDSKQKSDKNRQKITDILQKTAFTQRQEAAQAKREEQRRLEREKIYKEDDPEKQKRWEQKEARREQKKNKMRVKQLRVKSM